MACCRSWLVCTGVATAASLGSKCYADSDRTPDCYRCRNPNFHLCKYAIGQPFKHGCPNAHDLTDIVTNCVCVRKCDTIVQPNPNECNNAHPIAPPLV
jgi:hypothetical protein